jgi:hypothetical protein
MLDYLNSKFGEIETVMNGGILLAAIASVAIVYYKTKALVVTAGAFLLAGLVVWGTANVEWFSDKIGEEASLGPVPTTEVVVSPTGGPSAGELLAS